MSVDPKRGISALPRLVAEFMVIVVGVLVALGVDSWASAQADRALEREYLLRLLDDVRYDHAELDFVRAVTVSGLIYADSLLLEPEAWDEPDHLIGAILIAANARTPDLSRNTLRELVSSGRIALLRSAEVRIALAEYDRTVAEQEGYWTIVSYGLSDWADSNIPHRVQVAFDAACGDDPDDPGWSHMRVACPFDLKGWSADALREGFETEEARLMLTLYTSRHGRALEILSELEAAATDLESVLEEASR